MEDAVEKSKLLKALAKLASGGVDVRDAQWKTQLDPAYL